ncbi:hypothetical protein IFR05_006329 [Cadophora sp. M221]|nr:hypothetical protein IFR05_006329 [Cadophora sp. M221]
MENTTDSSPPPRYNIAIQPEQQRMNTRIYGTMPPSEAEMAAQAEREREREKRERREEVLSRALWVLVAVVFGVAVGGYLWVLVRAWG